MTDERKPLEPDNQKLDDDLSTWGIRPVAPSSLDYFPNDALISDEDVPPTPVVPEHRAD